MSLLPLFDAVASPIAAPVTPIASLPPTLTIPIMTEPTLAGALRDVDWQRLYDTFSTQQSYIGLFQMIFWNRLDDDFFMDASRNGDLIPYIEEGDMGAAQERVTGRQAPRDLDTSSIRILENAHQEGYDFPLVDLMDSDQFKRVIDSINSFNRQAYRHKITYANLLDASEPFGWTGQEIQAIPDSRKPSFLLFAKGVLNLFEDCKVALIQTAALVGVTIEAYMLDENFVAPVQPRQIRSIERREEARLRRIIRMEERDARRFERRQARRAERRQPRSPRMPPAPSVLGPLARQTAESN